MNLNRKLNFVVPIRDENDEEKILAYVHSTPISRQVYESFYKEIAKTYNLIMTELGQLVGPRTADLTLREVAQAMGTWDNPKDPGNSVRLGLVAEIHRLTNVLYVNEQGGWDMMPFNDAIRTGKISDEDAAKAGSAITFFIVTSALHNTRMQKVMVDGACILWGALTESSDCTDYLTSLRTSTAAVTSGAKGTAAA